MQQKGAFAHPTPLLRTSFTSPFVTPHAKSASPHLLLSCRVAAPTAAPPNQYAPPTENPYPQPAGTPAVFSQKIPQLSSVPEMLRQHANDPLVAQTPALVDTHHGDPVSLTYAQLSVEVDRFTAGLSRLGMCHGDFVSLFSENSYRWCIADQAIMTLGAVAAVRGVAAPVSELLYILSHSESKYLVVETASLLEKLVQAGLDLASLKFVVILFGAPPAIITDTPIYTYELVRSYGNSPKPEETTPVAKRTDKATLLYTSGTTQNPKGVMLTHDNLLTQLADICLGSFDPLPGQVFLSVLPCWHVFERTAGYWTLSKGMTLVYSNKRRFRDDLVLHKPHLLISVPRVFENLHAAIVAKLEKASALRKALFAFFMAVSLAFIKARRRLRLQDVSPERTGPFAPILDAIQMALLMPLYVLANVLVWKKIRAGLGGRIRTALSGGGSIPMYLEDFFECANIPICVGYGLTETSPVIANRFGQHNVRGSTGMNLPTCYVKIVDLETGKILPKGEQGTLFVAGPSVFSGYWKNPEATAGAFDSEGYFNTGDLAYFAPKGDIVITGRSKDVIVLSNGENIEPAAIEDAIRASPVVDQVMLVGQDKRSLGAIIVPQLDYLQTEGIVDAAFVSKVNELLQDEVANASELRKLEVELSENGEFDKLLSAEIRTRNDERKNYASFDRIAQYRILLVPFTVENGMMTQTLKIKKNVVTDVYATEVANLYS